jgi:hypothetical protein
MVSTPQPGFTGWRPLPWIAPRPIECRACGGKNAPDQDQPRSPIGSRRFLLIAGPVACRPCRRAPRSPLKLSGSYKADLAGTVSGGLAKRGRVLDDLQVFGDLDLDKAVGWKGATAHFELLNNSGAMPNDDAGTLQGVDNIEVTRQRARLFEAWVEQGFGDKGSVRAGLYDLNSEFYANDSAGLLLAPAFGIGSELAATGPNGPSIFPSTPWPCACAGRLARAPLRPGRGAERQCRRAGRSGRGRPRSTTAC